MGFLTIPVGILVLALYLWTPKTGKQVAWYLGGVGVLLLLSWLVRRR